MTRWRGRQPDRTATPNVPAGLHRPPRLRAGDRVAVVATAGIVPPQRLSAGVARLESWSLRVEVAEHVLDVHATLPYLAGADADRADDFTAAWTDPDVAALFVARGGYGTQRVIDLLDWDALAKAPPKVLVGFSDVTSLHTALGARLGQTTVHSHVVTSLGGATESSAEALRATLLSPSAGTDLLSGSEVACVVPGVVTGELRGGNLALLAADVGTTCSRGAAGAIVLLEDVLETPYRIDRLLTQLLRSGWFDGVAGIVLGSFADCGDPHLVDAVLAERLRPLHVPLVKGLDFGHTDSTVTVPLGVRATLDAKKPALWLDEPPLR
jgi:muramoyltetrapeptide carboxypeptidase